VARVGRLAPAGKVAGGQLVADLRLKVGPVGQEPLEQVHSGLVVGHDADGQAATVGEPEGLTCQALIRSSIADGEQMPYPT
jgi:hypothetical protein